MPGQPERCRLTLPLGRETSLPWRSSLVHSFQEAPTVGLASSLSEI